MWLQGACWDSRGSLQTRPFNLNSDGPFRAVDLRDPSTTDKFQGSSANLNLIVKMHHAGDVLVQVDDRLMRGNRRLRLISTRALIEEILWFGLRWESTRRTSR